MPSAIIFVFRGAFLVAPRYVREPLTTYTMFYRITCVPRTDIPKPYLPVARIIADYWGTVDIKEGAYFALEVDKLLQSQLTDYEARLVRFETLVYEI